MSVVLSAGTLHYGHPRTLLHRPQVTKGTAAALCPRPDSVAQLCPLQNDS